MTPLTHRKTLIAIFLLTVVGINAYAAPEAEKSRGELLYSTHCIACHTSQVHWRDKRLVTDWESLRKQVNRWQDTSHLGWNRDDIEAVSRYLNALHYHFPAETQDKAISQK